MIMDEVLFDRSRGWEGMDAISMYSSMNLRGLQNSFNSLNEYNMVDDSYKKTQLMTACTSFVEEPVDKTPKINKRGGKSRFFKYRGMKKLSKKMKYKAEGASSANEMDCSTHTEATMASTDTHQFMSSFSSLSMSITDFYSEMEQNETEMKKSFRDFLVYNNERTLSENPRRKTVALQIKMMHNDALGASMNDFNTRYDNDLRPINTKNTKFTNAKDSTIRRSLPDINNNSKNLARSKKPVIRAQSWAVQNSGSTKKGTKKNSLGGSFLKKNTSPRGSKPKSVSFQKGRRCQTWSVEDHSSNSTAPSELPTIPQERIIDDGCFKIRSKEAPKRKCLAFSICRKSVVPVDKNMPTPYCPSEIVLRPRELINFQTAVTIFNQRNTTYAPKGQSTEEKMICYYHYRTEDIHKKWQKGTDLNPSVAKGFITY